MIIYTDFKNLDRGDIFKHNSKYYIMLDNKCFDIRTRKKVVIKNAAVVLVKKAMDISPLNLKSSKEALALSFI